MKVKFLLITIIICLTQASLLNAQLPEIKTIEFPIEKPINYEQYAPFNTGQLLVIKTLPRNKKAKTLELEHTIYNTSLEQLSKEYVTLPQHMLFKFSDTINNTFFQLYAGRSDIYIVSINIDTKQVEVAKNILPKQVYVEDFAVLGNQAFIITSKRRKTQLMLMDLKTSELTPFVFPKEINLPESFELISLRKTKNDIAVIGGIYKGNPNLKQVINNRVIELSKQGTIIKDYTINCEPEMIVSNLNFNTNNESNLTTVNFSYIPDNKEVVSDVVFEKSVFNNCVKYAYDKGVMFSKKNKPTEFKTYTLNNFNDFEKTIANSFFTVDFMPFKNRGLNTLHHQLYSILPHDLYKLDDGLLFVGEVYWPVVSLSQTNSTVANGAAQTRSNLLGYCTEPIIVAKLDFEGNMIWSKTFSFSDSTKGLAARHLPKEINNRVMVNINANKSIAFTFASKDKIVSKTLSLDSLTFSEESFTKINIYSDEKKLRLSQLNIKNWTENEFLLFGMQSIKTRQSVMQPFKIDPEDIKHFIGVYH